MLVMYIIILLIYILTLYIIYISTTRPSGPPTGHKRQRKQQASDPSPKRGPPTGSVGLSLLPQRRRRNTALCANTAFAASLPIANFNGLGRSHLFLDFCEFLLRSNTAF